MRSKLLIITALLAVTACNRGNDPAPADDNMPANLTAPPVEEILPPDETPAAPMSDTSGADATNLTAAPAPEPLAEDEQMAADADATGLTARLPDDTGDTQPAE
jgi:hypothetical protein